MVALLPSSQTARSQRSFLENELAAIAARCDVAVANIHTHRTVKPSIRHFHCSVAVCCFTYKTWVLQTEEEHDKLELWKLAYMLCLPCIKGFLRFHTSDFFPVYKNLENFFTTYFFRCPNDFHNSQCLLVCGKLFNCNPIQLNLLVLCWSFYCSRSDSWCVPVSGCRWLFWDSWHSLNGRKLLIRTNHPQFHSSPPTRVVPPFGSLPASVKVPKLCHSILVCRLPSQMLCSSASGAEHWCLPQLQLSLMEEACHFYDPQTLLKAQPTTEVACFALLGALALLVLLA